MKGGVSTRRRCKTSNAQDCKENEVEDLVQKISALRVGVTTRQAARLAEQAKQEAGTEKVDTRKRPYTRKVKKIDGDLDVGEEDHGTANEVSREKATVPIGLANPGNMCFANATLQLLSASATFVSWADNMSKKYIERWKEDEECLLGISVLIDIVLIAQRAKLNGGAKGAARNALRKLRSHSLVEERDPQTGLGGAGQQDAQEFLQLVLLSLQKLEALSSTENKKRSNMPTPLSETMSGTTHVTRTCTVCKSATTTEYTWNVLTLYLAATCGTLSDCFENISKKETLNGSDMVSCENCNRKTKTFEQSRIISAANLLVVHLNLTTLNKKGTCKLRKTVSVPTIHPLKLYSPATKRSRKVNYELNAVVLHHGASMHSGHYTCYVRNQNDQWYLCNDDRVSQVQEGKLPFLQSKATSTTNPYILFFSKA